MRFLRVLLTIVLLLGAAYGVLALMATPAREHAYFEQFGDGPLVLAHGGGQRLWPDNTLEAFRGSDALGADVLEIDIHQDASGAFRVIHDATVDRTTNAVGAVADLPEAAFEEIDAGYRWTTGGPSAAESGEFHYRGQGVRIPTLPEVLSEFRNIAINIELKQDDAGAGRQLCSDLREAGVTMSVMVASFHTAPMRAFREACPEVATSATRAEVTLFYLLARARLAAVYSPPFEALQVPVKQGNLTVILPSVVRAAHSRNLRLQAWTINDSSEMERLLGMGIDGLITDRPDRALAAMNRAFDRALLPPFVGP